MLECPYWTAFVIAVDVLADRFWTILLYISETVAAADWISFILQMILAVFSASSWEFFGSSAGFALAGFLRGGFFCKRALMSIGVAKSATFSSSMGF